jgi:hypothetical protein
VATTYGIDGDVFDILPIGSSPVREPGFLAHVNGQASPHYQWYDSWQSVYDDVFPAQAWPGGYVILWYVDGDILCADCAKEHWMQTGIRLPHDLAGDNYGMGEYCGNCNAVIVEPGCADCGDECGDGFHEPAFIRINGDAQVCARCMADHVVSGDAVKVGKLRYDVAFNGPWYGGGEFVAEPTYRAKE